MNIDRRHFERWAERNVSQPSLAGYHGTLGEWVYHHNFVDMAWRAYQAGVKDTVAYLSDSLDSKEINGRNIDDQIF